MSSGCGRFWSSGGAVDGIGTAVAVNSGWIHAWGPSGDKTHSFYVVLWVLWAWWRVQVGSG